MREWKVPGTKALRAWEKGINVVDGDLTELEEFFFRMMEGCSVMGPRYWLAARAFHDQWEAAFAMQRQRSK